MRIQNCDFRPAFPGRAFLTFLFLALLSVGLVYSADTPQFPDGFRLWVDVGTRVVMPGSNPQLASEEGIHTIFANQKAADGYAAGNFADGSIIVYELRETKQQNGVIFEGDRKRVDVMIKDSAQYASTGGWRFERFWPSDPAVDAVPNAGVPCYQCHSKASAHGSVFSRLQ